MQFAERRNRSLPEPAIPAAAPLHPGSQAVGLSDAHQDPHRGGLSAVSHGPEGEVEEY